MDRPPRVLSIQSHVVHGYVGNKAATFPLQLLGCEVDPLNTVHLANHTGYTKNSGLRFDGDHITNIFESLDGNHLASYDAVLLGYIGSEPSCWSVHGIMKRIRSKCERAEDGKVCNGHWQETIFLLDPVMGDDGHLYVDKALVPLYRDHLLPLATIITPNQFEAETLTNLKFASFEKAWAGVDTLHGPGVRCVVVTSMQHPSDTEKLVLLGSDALKKDRFVISFPKRCGRLTGTGDLFAALLLARLLKGSSLRESCELAVATIQSMMAEIKQPEENLSNDDYWRHVELPLIQCRSDIQEPRLRFQAESWMS